MLDEYREKEAELAELVEQELGAEGDKASSDDDSEEDSDVEVKKAGKSLPKAVTEDDSDSEWPSDSDASDSDSDVEAGVRFVQHLIEWSKKIPFQAAAAAFSLHRPLLL